MGILEQGIFGAVKNKVGNLVGSSWKGIAVIKTKPVSVANPRTVGQINQRTKFSVIVKLASAILSTIIKPLWDRFAIRESGYNSFVSTNIDCVSAAGVIDPSLIVTSRGKMAEDTTLVVYSYSSAGLASIEWTAAPTDPFALPSDLLYIAVYDVNEQLMYGYATGVQRQAEGVAFTAKPLPVGSPVFLYLSWKRADGTIVSDSTTRFLNVTL